MIFGRGFWSPTIYQMRITEVCKLFADKNQMWYKIWIIVNFDDLKDTCWNDPGVSNIP